MTRFIITYRPDYTTAKWELREILRAPGWFMPANIRTISVSDSKQKLEEMIKNIVAGETEMLPSYYDHNGNKEGF